LIKLKEVGEVRIGRVIGEPIMKAISVTLAMLLGCATTNAEQVTMQMRINNQAPLSSSINDFLVDGRSDIGKRVTVTGCQFMFASADSITCAAVKIGNNGSPSFLGQILIEGSSLERENLRRALNNCTDFPPRIGKECSGDVTGTVYDVFSEIYAKWGLKYDGPLTLGLKNSAIEWAVP
jgi:hypothetical protein